MHSQQNRAAKLWDMKIVNIEITFKYLKYHSHILTKPNKSCGTLEMLISHCFNRIENVLIRWHVTTLYLQRGHIYTSSGSFFIEPVEEYTLDNQNILHKISREKLPIEHVNIDKYRNGKVLLDEMGVHEDDDGKIVDAIDDDLTQGIDEEIESNESNLDDEIINNGTIVPCTTENGKSKYIFDCFLSIFFSFDLNVICIVSAFETNNLNK